MKDAGEPIRDQRVSLADERSGVRTVETNQVEPLEPVECATQVPVRASELPQTYLPSGPSRLIREVHFDSTGALPSKASTVSEVLIRGTVSEVCRGKGRGQSEKTHRCPLCSKAKSC